MNTEKAYGICHLSIIPVRREPTSKSEQVSQLIFGETYQVIEKSKGDKFVLILTDFDQYQGWIEKSRWFEITKGFYDKAASSQQMMVADDVAQLKDLPYNKNLFLGSTLPLLVDDVMQWENHKMQFQEKVHKAEDKLGQKFILETSFRFLGTPYLWGGKTMTGIDCSGLVQQVFKLAGYQLPRDAYQQVEVGRELTDISSTLSGDLAFFARKERVTHVGIIVTMDVIKKLDDALANYLMKKLQRVKKEALEVKPQLKQPYTWIIQAYDCVRIDVLDNIGIYNLDEKKYTHLNKCFTRMIAEDKLDFSE
mgnify:CR=1 FL=1